MFADRNVVRIVLRDQRLRRKIANPVRFNDKNNVVEWEHRANDTYQNHKWTCGANRRGKVHRDTEKPRKKKKSVSRMLD